MTSDGAIKPAGELRCVLPPQWSRIAIGPLLELGVDAAGTDQAVALVQLREELTRSGLVLAALRLRGESPIAEVMTVAVPPREADGNVAVGHARFSGSVAEVIHCDRESGDDGFPISVQLVRLMRPADRGVIVTIVSTETKAAEELADELRAFADTFELV